MWRPYGVYQEVCARAQTRADQNSSTSSCHWLTSTPNYIFWLRFWQIDIARLWNLACLRPSWQYWKQVYNLPALESSDGLTNAQCTLSLVFVFCCVLNHSTFMNIVETILNNHICLLTQEPDAPFFGFGATLMTLFKHSCTGSIKTLVDVVKLGTITPQPWSSTQWMSLLLSSGLRI